MTISTDVLTTAILGIVGAVLATLFTVIWALLKDKNKASEDKMTAVEKRVESVESRLDSIVTEDIAKLYREIASLQGEIKVISNDLKNLDKTMRDNFGVMTKELKATLLSAVANASTAESID